MYISKITVSEGGLKQPDFWKIFRSPYSLHKAAWGIFADHPERKRDFMYRLDNERNLPLIYVVSSRKPGENNGFWHIEKKRYEPKIKAGMQLAFLLRVNPVIAKRDEDDKQHRHDAVMDAKETLKRQGMPKNKWPSNAQIIYDSGCTWLLSRAEKNGFTFRPEHLRVDGYRQHHFLKGKADKPVSFSTLEFNGLLTVTDPEPFVKMLFKGLGPAKSFGCGLMLVKRA